MTAKEPKYYIENKLKPPKAFFDWCYSQISTFKWSNKRQTILASDRSDCFVIEKRLTKSTNLTFFHDFRTFAIVLVTSKRIEIQSYGLWSRINEGKQTIECELTNFEQFASGKHIMVTRLDNGRPVFGLTPNKPFGGPYAGTALYPNGWADKVRDISELRYLKIERLSPLGIENIYKYRREIEFLQKINANNLANQVMHPGYTNNVYGSWRKNVDMRTINENWLRKNKQFFKNSDRTFLEYELEKRIKERNGKVVPGIERYLDYRDISKIPRGVGIIRFQNWMIKNKVNFKYYLDYLSLLKDLGIQLDENLIIPKDLEKAHDNAVELLNQMQREVNEKMYEKRLKAILKYENIVGDCAFLVPKDLNELVAEGKALHHCVGGSGYIDGHKQGKTTIIFIRQKEAIEKPFYTLELKNESIVQLRGKHNQVAPPEVKEAADSWLGWLKTQKV
jgi:hypothetical protein